MKAVHYDRLKLYKGEPLESWKPPMVDAAPIVESVDLSEVIGEREQIPPELVIVENHDVKEGNSEREATSAEVNVGEKECVSELTDEDSDASVVQEVPSEKS